MNKEKSKELLVAYKELAFQNEEKEKRAAELVIANIELDFQSDEKEKRAAELGVANTELAFQNEEKEKRAAELVIANIELDYQNEEKIRRAAELVIANIELAFQNIEKGKRAAELVVANIELAFQNTEKGKRAEELIIANRELAFQNDKKEKRAAELIIANNELVHQNGEKEKRAAELIIANKELAFQNEEKGKRASELAIANIELDFQNKEKEKRAAELSIANIELVFQNEEKEKRAAELVIANIELQKTELALRKSNELFSKLFDNNPAGICVSRISDGKILNVNDAFVKLFGFADKEDIMLKSAREIIHHLNLDQINIDYELKETEPVRDFELNVRAPNGDMLWISVSMMELDVDEVPCRLSVSIGITARKKAEKELIAINNELAFQNEEKEKRAAELVIANKELAFQNEEKEKRAEELIIANRELEQFAYIASHDLQEPLRTISNYMRVFEEDYLGLLDDKAHGYLHSVNNSIKRMSVLIKSLLDFSRLDQSKKLVNADCNTIVAEVMADLDILIKTTNASIEVTKLPHLNVYETEMRQVFQNLISNAIKFQKKDNRPEIRISAEQVNGKWRFAVSDNGIGIAPAHYERVFDIFRRLHSTKEYAGNGIGLANCKKIVQMHKGTIWVESTLGYGSTFYFTISNLTE